MPLKCKLAFLCLSETQPLYVVVCFKLLWQEKSLAARGRSRGCARQADASSGSGIDTNLTVQPHPSLPHAQEEGLWGRHCNLAPGFRSGTYWTTFRCLKVSQERKALVCSPAKMERHLRASPLLGSRWPWKTSQSCWCLAVDALWEWSTISLRESLPLFALSVLQIFRVWEWRRKLCWSSEDDPRAVLLRDVY